MYTFIILHKDYIIKMYFIFQDIKIVENIREHISNILRRTNVGIKIEMNEV